MKRVLTVMAPGFEEIEAVAPIDVLTRVGVKVDVASLDGELVASAYGITLAPSISLGEANKPYDGIVFPGGRRNAESLASDPRVTALIRDHCSRGKLIAAICASPSHVLAEAAGILEGVRATGDPAFNDRLAGCGAIVTGELVTVDGAIITGMGPGAAMLFALALAEFLIGREASEPLRQKWRVSR